LRRHPTMRVLARACELLVFGSNCESNFWISCRFDPAQVPGDSSDPHERTTGAPDLVEFHSAVATDVGAQQ
jgi:hypothetical protein